MIVLYDNSRYTVICDKFSGIQWFRDLTDRQKDEFVSLETDEDIPVEVIRDWIEEHGGKRDWWLHIQVRLK